MDTIEQMSQPLESSPTSAATRLTLLMLDDQPDIIKSLTRVLRRDYQLVSFTKGEEAIEYLKQHPVQLILSDMRMPGMNGAEFLTQARQLQPEAVRLLLTGYSETDAAIAAINEGGIHTYLSKPWDNDALKLSLSKAAEFYLLQQERDQLLTSLAEKNQQLEEANHSLENKVKARTKNLTTSNTRLEKLSHDLRLLYRDLLSMLSLAVGERTGHGPGQLERLAMHSRKVALQLGLTEQQASSIQISALLHNIGVLSMGGEEAEFINPMVEIELDESSHAALRTARQQRLVINENTMQMLNRLNRFHPHQKIVSHQDENYDGTGVPAHLGGDDIPIGARIIRVVRDFEHLISGQGGHTKFAPAKARHLIAESVGRYYDPAVVQAFLTVQRERPQNIAGDVEYCIGMEELQAGQILMRDLILANGKTMLTAGSILNSASIDRIRDYAAKQADPIVVSIKESE